MNRILVAQTAFLGDVVLSQPLWASVRRFWPDAEVDVLVQPQWASLVEPDADVREVISFDKRDRDRGVTGLVRLARDLRARKYDLALCPHPSFRSALLLRLAGIGRRVGFHDSAGAVLFTDRVRRDTTVHEVDRVLSLLGALGRFAPDEVRAPQLTIANDVAAEGEARLAAWGLAADRPYACVHPGSVWATKRWLPERFAAVLSDLADDGFMPVVLGGPDDVEVANTVGDNCRTKPVNLAGRLSLPELALILDRAALLVSGDSGPMHIAGGLGTPVVAVFGSTVPAFGYGPVGSPSRIVQRHLPCRPCGPHGFKRCPLGHFSCMNDLPAAAVTTAARELLAL
jgi:lipopolysaccharide heptosyltransferase II